MFVLALLGVVALALAGGWLVAKLVHFTFLFLQRKVKEWFSKYSDTESIVAVDTKKAKADAEKQLREVMGKIAEQAKRKGNTYSVGELEEQAKKLREGISTFDDLRKQNVSQLLGRVDRDGKVTDFEAYNNGDSSLDPELEKKMKDGTILISR